jgi:hypothetical protein
LWVAGNAPFVTRALKRLARRVLARAGQRRTATLRAQQDEVVHVVLGGEHDQHAPEQLAGRLGAVHELPLLDGVDVDVGDLGLARLAAF